MAIALGLAIPAAHGCKRTGDGGDKPAASASASASAAGSVETSTSDDQVQPVYPALSGAPDPAAVRLCGIVHGEAAKRRAACCKAPEVPGLQGECLRNVTGALRGGAVTVDDAALAACESAVRQDLEGCDWVAAFPFAPPLPPACHDLFRGTRKAGTVCRSSLECEGTLHCSGLGPTSVGRCAPARDEGSCGASVDPLAVHALQTDVEARHPSCTGFCDRRRCAKRLALGDACTYNEPCGPGRHCGDGKCKAGEAGKAGEPCLGLRCERGLRCDEGKCVAPRKENDACERHTQCRGECVAGADGKRCQARCALGVVPPMPSAQKPLRLPRK